MRVVEEQIRKAIVEGRKAIREGNEFSRQLSKRDRVHTDLLQRGVLLYTLWKSSLYVETLDGKAHLYSRGWRSRTTKARLNALGGCITQVKGRWFDWKTGEDFAEGVEIDAVGQGGNVR